MRNLFKVFVPFLFIFAFFGFTQNASANEVNCKYSSGTKCVQLTGYGWGASSQGQYNPFGGIGWINFNNTSTGSNTAVSGKEYYVEYNRDTGLVQGFAWSERYGYLKFGGFSGSGSESFPDATACKDGTNSSANCNSQIVKDTNDVYNLVGYARFCFVYNAGCSGNLKSSSQLGDFDGWVALSPGASSFGGITYSTSSNGFKGFAWAGGAVSQPIDSAGSGQIAFDPTGGGIKCATQTNCISDSQSLPKVTLDAVKNPVIYTDRVVVRWKIENIPNGCTTLTPSSPANTIWANATSDISNNLSGGTLDVGTISADTTFSLSCTYANQTGSDSTVVNLLTFTPVVRITNVPSTSQYGQNIAINYTVTNVPYNVTGRLLQNGNLIRDNINISGNGDEKVTYSGSIAITNLTDTSTWELIFEDTTNPQPPREGKATANTTVIVPNPQVSFDVYDIDTNSKTDIGCTNSGARIEYGMLDVKPGSCRALTNFTGSDPDWGSTTSIVENGGVVIPDDIETVTTGPITTNPADPVYYSLRCEKLDGTPFTVSQMLDRSCNTPRISLTPQSTCVEKGTALTGSPILRVNYFYENLRTNSCTFSTDLPTPNAWSSPSPFRNSGPNSGGSQNISYPTYLLTSGTDYVFSVAGCRSGASPFPSIPPQTVVVSVKDTCTPVVPGANRVSPTFKEF